METKELSPEYAEMAKKMEQMDEALNKNLFANPIRELQEKYRQELLDIKETFMKNVNEYKQMMSTNNGTVPTEKVVISNTSSEEVQNLRTELEHKKYQVEILKKAFSEYENKAENEINGLQTENAKLKYRVNILLKTIEQLEHK